MLITVELEAQTGSFVTDIDRASKAAAKDLQRMRAESEKALSDFGKILGTAAAGAGVAVAAMVKNALDAADDLGDLSEKTGVAVDDLSKLAYAAKLSDVELEGLQQGLVKLGDSAVKAMAGTGDAATAFKALGVSVTDSEGRLKSNYRLLLDTADAFAQFEDGPAKAAAALDIFGKSGADLIPLLNGGSEAIRQAGDELERLGGVVTPEAAKNAATWKHNLIELEAASSGFATQLGAQLSPVLVDITNHLVDLTTDTEATKRAAEGAEVIFRGLAGSAVVVGNAFQILGDNVGATAAILSAVAHGDFAGAAEIMRARMDDLKTDINDILTAFDKKPAALSEPFKESGQAAEDAKRKVLDYSAALKAAKEEKPVGKDEQDPIAGLTDQFVDKGTSIFDTGEGPPDQLPGLDTKDVFDEQTKNFKAHQDEMTRLAREGEEARRQIQEDALAAGVDALAYAAEAAQSLGKEGFQAFKAFAIVQTLIDTYVAAQGIYKSIAAWPLPYGANYALAVAGAASATAAGLARVSQIRSLEPSGYAEGGFIPGGEQTIRVNEQGNEMVMNAPAVRKHRGLLEAINDGDFAGTAIDGGERGLTIINNAPGVTISRRANNTVTLDMLPEILEMFEQGAADGVLSGRSPIGAAVGATYGMQRGAQR